MERDREDPRKEAAAEASGALSGILEGLANKACWGIIASDGGSVLMKFGGKIRKKVPTRRRGRPLTDDELLFHGALEVFVTCAWRLDGPTDVLAVWSDPTPHRQPLHPRLAELRGLRIVEARVLQPAFDLEIHWEGRRTLKIFCDRPLPEDVIDNWSVSNGDTLVSVGSNGRLTVE